MVTYASLVKSGDMRLLADEVLRELVLADFDAGDCLFALPSLYPGGSAVVVRVRREGDEFVVTDQGNGYLEAELLGGATTFSRLAPEVAHAHSVKYDGDMFFAIRVSRDHLANAIIFIGAASRHAVEKTAEKLSEEREHGFRQILQSHLREAFHERVAFEIEVRGQSTKAWRFDALVKAADHLSVFELVTPHHISINSSIVKFQDVSALEESVAGIAVLSNRAKMEAHDITLLSRSAAKVIPLDADRETLLKAA